MTMGVMESQALACDWQQKVPNVVKPKLINNSVFLPPKPLAFLLKVNVRPHFQTEYEFKLNTIIPSYKNCARITDKSLEAHFKFEKKNSMTAIVSIAIHPVLILFTN